MMILVRSYDYNNDDENNKDDDDDNNNSNSGNFQRLYGTSVVRQVWNEEKLQTGPYGNGGWQRTGKG